MRQFICLMKPTGSPRGSDNYRHIFQQHGAYLNDMAGQGHVIFAGYTDGENPGELSLAVLSANDKEHAEMIMSAAPAVSAQLLSAEVEPFEVFLSKDFSS